MKVQAKISITAPVLLVAEPVLVLNRNVRRSTRILPGFRFSLGYTVLYLSLIVLLPLAVLFLKASTMHWAQFWSVITSPRVLASYKLTFATSLIAAAVNTVCGFVLAWVLARYRFVGKEVFDAVLDLPFALPTAVTGIALTSLYADNGWVGKELARFGIHIAFTPAGIVLAMMFISIPFIVRSVQPVLEDLDHEIEEAASSLGANSWQVFRRVIFPNLLPALLTGFGLSLARSIAEYGSVVFISGNMPMRTEITSLLIITKLEQYDYAGANAIAVMMLAASFALLLTINLLERWSRRFQEPIS
ncbi:MAG: sulfate ABC transporter permease subunit CysT [Candidatus Angelobacter sp.]